MSTPIPTLPFILKILLESDNAHLEPDAEEADIIPVTSTVILEPSTLTAPTTPDTPVPAIGKLVGGTIPIKLLNAKSLLFIL